MKEQLRQALREFLLVPDKDPEYTEEDKAYFSDQSYQIYLRRYNESRREFWEQAATAAISNYSHTGSIEHTVKKAGEVADELLKVWEARWDKDCKPTKEEVEKAK